MKSSQSLSRAAAAVAGNDLHEAVAQLTSAIRVERHEREREVRSLLTRIRNLEYALHAATGKRTR